MLYHMMHSLLLLPIEKVNPALHELMAILPVLDKLCKILPSIKHLETLELEGSVGKN